MRPWPSRVLSEVASHHSCKSDSMQPLPHYHCALETPGFSVLGSNLIQGNRPESRETHLRRGYCTSQRRDCCTSQRCPAQGWTKGLTASPNDSFFSYWRLPRKMQLVFSAILDTGIYLMQSVYSLSTRHLNYLKSIYRVSRSFYQEAS